MSGARDAVDIQKYQQLCAVVSRGLRAEVACCGHGYPSRRRHERDDHCSSVTGGYRAGGIIVVNRHHHVAIHLKGTVGQAFQLLAQVRRPSSGCRDDGCLHGVATVERASATRSISAAARVAAPRVCQRSHASGPKAWARSISSGQSSRAGQRC